MGVDERLDGLDQRLRFIEERLSLLEGGQRSASVKPPETVIAAPESDTGSGTVLLVLAGKALFVLGGAFLLRAATESAALPAQTGVLLGFLYAIGWGVAATYAARAGRRLNAVFSIVVAAIVAYPIVWEATTRFHVLSATAAAILLAAMSIALIAMARRFSLHSPAWIAVAGATFDALLLAYATKEVIPFALELTVAGIVAFLLTMKFAGWLLAIESDLVAIFLIIAAVIDESKDSRSSIVISLLLFSALWMIVTRRVREQVAVASLIGLAGAAALVLPASSAAILGGVAAVVAAEIAHHTSWRVFALQSAAWGVFAGVASGLFAYTASAFVEGDAIVATPLPALATAALCLAAFFRLNFARLPLLAIAACGAAGLTIHAVMRMLDASAVTHALLRTAILVVMALALASIGRVWRVPEASQLGAVTLVLTGVQVIVQELLTGRAGIMFAALAIYGSAMLGIAKLRRTSAASA
ncbi:MAG TPA: hypothetical protein VHX14_15370 [Thermoanaerobaculia bacterium]|jgi:hypothetical protein|nr:hypothetical protein [Thermoanaerobaculia bacterium]